MHDVLSATEERPHLSTKQWQGGSKLIGKQGGDRSEVEADNDALLIKASQKTRKTGCAPVDRATANKSCKPTRGSGNVVKNALEKIKAKAISLGTGNKKELQDA